MTIFRVGFARGVCLAWSFAALACSAAALSQPIRADAPSNVVSLQAQGSAEVAQDMLTVLMSTTRDGVDAAAVQSQLKTALDAALAEAKKVAQAGQVDVRTGNFNLYPRHGRDGKINGWQGSAELVLEGRDFVRISQLAGRIQTLTLGGISFGLSRETRTRVEAEVTLQAIERFRQQAQEISRAFGFSGYSVREVSVNAADQGFVGRPRVAMMAAKSMGADESVPLEAGRSTVVVSVSGSVQMK